MTSKKELDLLGAIITRFRDDYFIRGLGTHGLFCIPNFVAMVAGDKLQIQLLNHVSETDEIEIRDRLGELPYEVLSERLTLAEVEERAGINLPDID